MSHNVGAVIRDVEAVKVDLEGKVVDEMFSAMGKMLSTAVTHVEDDADWRGNLKKSLEAHGVEHENPELRKHQFSIGTDADIAPYGPFVEFGTGGRSDVAGPGAISARQPHQFPAGYPYESPDVEPEQLVGEILDWVQTKPVQPKKGDEWAAAMGISKSIIANGTHAHPFLRPAYYKHRMRLKRASRKAVKKAFS